MSHRELKSAALDFNRDQAERFGPEKTEITSWFIFVLPFLCFVGECFKIQA